MDYKKDTREAYQDDNVAHIYHAAFATDHGFSSYRFRLVAKGEIASVREFLVRLKHVRVVDIPAGTGKLAPMLAELGADVVACDISSNMLEIARGVYSALGYDKVEFHVCDAARVSSVVQGDVDAVICLRLMHRVPPAVREAILSEFAKIASHVIVSYGVETRFHRLRRFLRGAILGGGVDGLSFSSRSEIEKELMVRFDIVSSRSVIPFLSQERVYLLRAR